MTSALFCSLRQTHDAPMMSSFIGRLLLTSEVIAQQLLAGTRVSRRVCAHDRSVREAAFFSVRCQSALIVGKVTVIPAFSGFFFLKAEISILEI